MTGHQEFLEKQNIIMQNSNYFTLFNNNLIFETPIINIFGLYSKINCNQTLNSIWHFNQTGE